MRTAKESQTVQQRLNGLRGRHTTYEVVLCGSNGERLLVAYVGRKSKRGLLHALQSKGEKIVEQLGLTNEHRMTYKKSHGFDFGNGWSARWGRTERSSVVEGEHERI